MTVTRRDFLHGLARTGGYAATFSAMQALGLLAASEASALTALPADLGKGRTVVILGAGVAGLTAAYELRKAGFTPIVLEATKRPGGRNWSMRKGDGLSFTDGTRQECDWDEGHYFNMGPARIPSIHTHVLDYCQELGVPLEVEINTSRSTLMQAPGMNGGKPVEQRRVIHDTRGHIAELLSKAIDKRALDDLLSAEDITKLRGLLKGFGPLDDAMTYVGSDRAGFSTPRGAGPNAGVLNTPLPLHDLLVADMTKGEFYEEHIDWQATMFQPIGGMDRIPAAFAKSLGDIVRYECPVREIRNTAKGVQIAYSQGGKAALLDADFCISTLPAPVLKSIKGNLSPKTLAAAATIKMASRYKIAWEAPRFWEKTNNIYGGISFLQGPVDLVWYPSNALFSPRGIVIGGFGDLLRHDGSISPMGQIASTEAKFAASRKAIDTLHPGHGADLAKPFYVDWTRVPHQLGCYGEAIDDAGRAGYAHFDKPDGQVWFASDWLSRLSGWQEGAVLSAHRAVQGIAERVKAA